MILRCFVAMAFGHEDTDKVYDDLILQVLQDKDVKPIRVDRIEHNDDIDDRIISELQICDFALADLTYARPSAYFEAGLAQGRKVPVIYTCRKDHLSPKADDTFGNFRVHFDLQMKNIIPWSSSSDHRFSERLAKRITRVIAPLLLDKETKQMERQETEKFAALSLEEKIERILNICISHVERTGYRGIHVEYESIFRRFPLFNLNLYPIFQPYPSKQNYYCERGEFRRILCLRPGWLGTKFVNGTIHEVFVHVTSNLKKSLLTTLHGNLLRHHPVYDINIGLKSGALRQLVEHLFVCSLQKVPISRVMASLPGFQLDREHNEFIWVGEQVVPTDKIAGYKEVYVMDPMLGLMVRPDKERFLVRNRKSKAEEELEVEGNHLLKSSSLSPVGQVRHIPRHVHIRIFDAIKFERSFEEMFSNVCNGCPIP